MPHVPSASSVAVDLSSTVDASVIESVSELVNALVETFMDSLTDKINDFDADRSLEKVPLAVGEVSMFTAMCMILYEYMSVKRVDAEDIKAATMFVIAPTTMTLGIKTNPQTILCLLDTAAMDLMRRVFPCVAYSYMQKPRVC